MKILSIECSAGPASTSIFEDGKIIASSFVNKKLTHSQTLMPMIVDMVNNSLTNIKDIDYIAVSAGPGSFTGLRIGISAAKGLAAPHNIKCISVSTLEGMAQLQRGDDCIVCAVMDARCNQVYSALFDISDEKITRLCDDRALLCSQLADEIKKMNNNKKIIVCGDGADLFYPYISELNASIATEERKYQNAVGIGLYASQNIENLRIVSAEELLPIYLRLPQAERELLNKKRG